MDKKERERLLADIKYGTNIIPEEEYINMLVAISDVSSDMVEKTLGPYGKTTMLNDGITTYPTKDGWHVLQSLTFSDSIYNTLYIALRQVSFDMVRMVGDGSTTSYIGANIFMHLILQYLEKNDVRQSEFLDLIKETIKKLSERLLTSKYVRYIDREGDFSDIYNIAKVSSNGNEDIAVFIQNIYSQTNNPNIYVTLDPGQKLSYEIQNGYKFSCKPINHRIYINSDDQTYTSSEPAFAAIFDHNVNFQEHEKIITGLSRYATQYNKTCIIFAPHYDDVLLHVIGVNMNSLKQTNQVPNIMLVQVPLSMNIHREYLSDLRLLTNSQIIDYGIIRAFNALWLKQTNPKEKIEDALLKTAQYNFENPTEVIDKCVGTIKKIVAGKDYVLLQEYEGVVNEELYDTTIKEVHDNYIKLKEKAEKSSYGIQKDYTDAFQHYTRLLGRVGVIKIGATSDLEKSCLKDSVEDAVFSCKSAYDNGYVRGLNLSTINVISEMIVEMGAADFKSNKDKMMTDILNILRTVFTKLSEKVLNNKNPKNSPMTVCSIDGSECERMMNNNEIINEAVKNEYGFDLVGNKFLTDKDCYIVNSVKTDVEILKGIGGIISTVLTSNQFLSVNRSYDRAMGERQRKENMIELEKEKYAAITEAVLGVMKKYEDDLSWEAPLIKD